MTEPVSPSRRQEFLLPRAQPERRVPWARPPKRLLGLAMTLGLALVPLAASLSACQSKAPEPPAASVPRRVSALGRLEPETRIRKVSVPSSLNGDRVQDILVEEGEQVKKGQPLAVLNSKDSLQASLTEAEENVTLARRKLDQVKAGAKQGEIQAQVFKVQSLERKLAGEKLAQDQNVNSKRASMQEARTEAKRYDALFSSGGASELERDRYRTRAQTSEAELNRAIETRAGTLSSLSAEIESEKQKLDQVKEVRPVDVAASESELRKAIASRDKAKQELAFATVLAPQDGRILKVVVQPGDKVGDAGILEMADTSRMVVTAEVYQTDIKDIRLGQGASISADGFDGHARANVYQILPQVQRQSIFAGEAGENQDQRVFQVRLRIDPTDLRERSIGGASNLQVNVVFDPLSAEQRAQRSAVPPASQGTGAAPAGPTAGAAAGQP
ncbi:MAG: efflux RND transporter periplasmic adaptor subunit [Synechococcaceae cyanobacterium]